MYGISLYLILLLSKNHVFWKREKSKTTAGVVYNDWSQHSFVNKHNWGMCLPQQPFPNRCPDHMFSTCLKDISKYMASFVASHYFYMSLFLLKVREFHILMLCLFWMKCHQCFILSVSEVFYLSRNVNISFQQFIVHTFVLYCIKTWNMVLESGECKINFVV